MSPQMLCAAAAQPTATAGRGGAKKLAAAAWWSELTDGEDNAAYDTSVHGAARCRAVRLLRRCAVSRTLRPPT